MAKLTLQAGEQCECGENLAVGVRMRTYEFEGKSVAVEMYGLWCACGKGVVDLRSMDLIREALDAAYPV